MSSVQVNVKLFPIHKEQFIPAVARTIHRSFSSDPLIQWLRPNASPWIKQDHGTWSWQCRRIQRIILEGEVFRSASVQQMAMRCPRKDLDTRSSVSKPEISTFPHSETDLNSGDDAGAVVFLFPPPGRKPWTIQRIWLACKLWVLDRLKPADDNGASEKRVDVLFDKHESSAELLQKIYARNKLWYLEVIAVHPSLQSRGLGGGVMRWILEHVHNEPIYLECTRKENVGFYERFGFEVVEEVELVDEQEVLRHWVMVRPGVL